MNDLVMTLITLAVAMICAHMWRTGDREIAVVGGVVWLIISFVYEWKKDERRR